MSDTDPVYLDEVLKSVLDGRTAAHVAVRAGMSRSTISRALTGSAGLTVEARRRIADVLGLDDLTRLKMYDAIVRSSVIAEPELTTDGGAP